MRTTPPSWPEIDAWLLVLLHHGQLHRAELSPEGAWTIQRTLSSTPHTLHHPVLALDFVAEVLRDVRREAARETR